MYSYTEYDPLEPNRRAVKARVGRLRDPCSRVLDKRAEENGLLADKGELLFQKANVVLFVLGFQGSWICGLSRGNSRAVVSYRKTPPAT